MIVLPVLSALLIPATSPAPRSARGAETHSATLRIGVVGSLFRNTSEPLMQVMLRPFKSLLETQAGIAGQVVPSGEAEVLGQALKDDQVQLGVFHGVEFAWARLKNPKLKALIIAVHQQRTLRACLMVRRDSKVANVADLRGSVMALPRLSREHCRLYLERRCVEPGTRPDKFYAKVTTPHDTEDALDDVFEGKAKAAVIDAVELEQYRKTKPRRSSQLCSLQESEPFPAAVVAYYPGAVNEELLLRLRDGMIAAKDTPTGQALLNMCRITSFEEVPADYDQLLANIAKAYPPQAAPK
jgi:ABC-type phosphate/phosphonate transport system substrate-binding protein